MSRRAAAASQQDGSADVVHFVGKLTPVVLGFLLPAVRALDKAGFSQLVIVVSDGDDASALSDIGARAKVHFVASSSRVRRWLAGLRSMMALLTRSRVAGVHFHGFVPLALGGMVMRLRGYNGHIYYSPHGSRAHGQLRALGSWAYAVISTWVRGQSFVVIADRVGDNSSLLAGRPDAVQAVATPIDEAFYDIERIEAPEAIVVGGCTAAAQQDIGVFCQLVVMLPHVLASGVRVKYFWTGPVPPGQEALLKAAEIGRVTPRDERARLELLSTAWLFLAPISGRGYPRPLVEAMACGLPCVAVNAPEHGALIENGADGLLFDTAHEAIQHVDGLLEASEKRHSLGRAAAMRIRSTRSRSAFEGQVMPLFKDLGPSTILSTDGPVGPG